MRAALKMLRHAGLVVAGLLIMTAALRLAGAGSAPPSPTYKWDQGWHPAWTAVIPIAKTAANQIIAGTVGPQVIAPLHVAHRNLPVGVPRPITCLDMMVNALAKRRGQPAYAIRRAREAVECYEGATITAGPAPRQTCRDQVTVTSFQAHTKGGLAWRLEPHDPNQLTLDTIVDGATPGITFTATATLRDGAVPLDHLHLRYIQNKTRYTGTIFYAPPPHFVPVLRDGTTLPPHDPLLDRPAAADRRLPLPFYTGQFQETPPAGTARRVTASDSPGTAVHVIRKHPRGRFQHIDLTETFRMFLVCVDGRQRGAVEVLRQLEWTLRYGGTFDAGSRIFTPDPKAGITAEPSSLARDVPVVEPPLSNAFSTFKLAQ
jgi:hypothetical protein